MSDASTEGDGAPAKKSKKTLFIILGAVIILLLGGGGAAWYFKPGKAKPHAQEENNKQDDAKKTERVFITLDPFVVNLADQDGDRYAQIGLVLEVQDKKQGDQVTRMMPAIRNTVLLLLSSKTAEQLITRAGKEQLAKDIAIAAAAPIGWKPPPPRKTKKASSEDAGNTSEENAEEDTPPAEPPPPPPSNPIVQVHFSSFIVQ